MIRILNNLGLLSLVVILKRNAILVIVSGTALAIVAGISWTWGQDLGLAIVFSFALAIILTIQIATRDEQRQHYWQLEALLSMISQLELRAPLPRMRSWAISPDFANLLMTLVSKDSPKIVVETGCGVSTVILAYCLEKLGNARLYSLEHDREYAARVRATLSEHRLDGVAQVIDSPLKRYELNGKSWLSYDMDTLDKIDQIDLLIIDGPPKHCQRLARYPVLPLLRSKLSGNSIVVLDDASRRDERRVLAEWQKEFNDFSSEILPLEKGAAVLRRKHVDN